MKKRSLMYQSLAQFTACVGILLLLATPLFYWLTKNFYAEDMIDIIEAVQQGKPVPALDLEEDILHGIMIQFALIVSVLGAALVLTMRFISGRLWQPYEKALKAIEGFRLENGVCPALEESGTEEFARLNAALERLMAGSLHSYRHRAYADGKQQALAEQRVGRRRHKHPFYRGGLLPCRLGAQRKGCRATGQQRSVRPNGQALFP